MAINQIFLQNFKKKVIYDKFLNKKIRKTSWYFWLFRIIILTLQFVEKGEEGKAGLWIYFEIDSFLWKVNYIKKFIFLCASPTGVVGYAEL